MKTERKNWGIHGERLFEVLTHFAMVSRRIVNPELYAPQTKSLEGRANISECVFEEFLKGVSTRLGLPIVEKCFENAF